MNHCRIGRKGVRCRTIARRSIFLVVATMLAGLVLETADAKTPGSTYCFLGTCHRVKTIGEMQKMVGQTVTLHASHYDDPKRDRFNPSNITSSGEFFRWDRPDNAASPIYPDGTRLLLWNPETKQAAEVRINNAGPYWGKRNLDVSRTTAERLGFAKQGVATLRATVLAAPTQAEATYRRGRTYPPVQGHIGFFDSIEMASLAILRTPGTLIASTADYAAGAHAAAGRIEAPAPAAAQPIEAGVVVASAESVDGIEAEPVPVPVALKESAKQSSNTVAERTATKVAAAKRPAKTRNVVVASRANAVRRTASRVAKAKLRVTPTRLAASIRDTRERPSARSGNQQVVEGRRVRVAQAEIRGQQVAGMRCRPGYMLRVRGGEGRQTRVICVSSAEDGAARSSRSPSGSLRVASIRNRS